MAPRAPSRIGELAAIERIRRFLPATPEGQVWLGDDAAVIPTGGQDSLLFASDLVVADVHFDLSLSSPADIGWKALAVNLSDLGAMAGTPLCALVSLALPGSISLDGLYEGLGAAAQSFGCPIVGGDLSESAALVVAVAVAGTSVGGSPVLRSGAQAGDVLFVTGPLGRSAAGLALLRRDPDDAGDLATAHRRPWPRLEEGRAARAGGATAMIDLSDGLGIDLDRLARASGVGVELDFLPVAPGASFAEALGGGEDYELCFVAPDGVAIDRAFTASGLRPPIAIGRCVAQATTRLLAGEELPPAGWQHDIS